jgi:hypothetical protein
MPAKSKPFITFLADPPLIDFGAAACVIAALLTFLGLFSDRAVGARHRHHPFGRGITARDGLMLGPSGGLARSPYAHSVLMQATRGVSRAKPTIQFAAAL